MNYRTLGRTGLRVSEIGFGTWGVGGPPHWRDGNDAESRRSLYRAVELGINFFDTALVYGNGHAESLIGELALRVGRDKLLIATKIPPKNGQWPARCGIPPKETFPPDHIRRSTESSLRNLRTDHIDLQQLHVWQDHWLESDDWQEELLRLKQEGKIRFVGVSINDHDPESAMLLAQHRIADVVQIIYNIFDPLAAEALLPLCEAANIGVITRVPFDEGGLTGELTAQSSFAANDFRSFYFQGKRPADVESRIQALRPMLGAEAQTVPELALRFCLSHPNVSSVIPGMRKPLHVESNVAVSDGRRLSPELLNRLASHAWPRNFYAPSK